MYASGYNLKYCLGRNLSFVLTAEDAQNKDAWRLRINQATG